MFPFLSMAASYIVEKHDFVEKSVGVRISYDVIAPWPDPTRAISFKKINHPTQKLHKRSSISYLKFQREPPSGSTTISRLFGSWITPSPDWARVNLPCKIESTYVTVDKTVKCVFSILHGRNVLISFLCQFNPRPCRGVDATLLPWVFLEWLPNRSADDILHSLWGILCAAFGKKNDRVRSGHGAMTS